MPMAFLKAEQQAEQSNAVDIETYLGQSLLRFGRGTMARWRAELSAQNEAEIQEAEKIRERLKQLGFTNVSVLF